MGKYSSGKPAPNIVLPTCPNHLSGDAKREWRRLVPLLAELGIISRLDRTTLAAHCEAYGLFCKAGRKLKKEGLVVEVGDNGYRQQSPWLGIYNNAISQMQKYIGQLGLSPAAREALAIDTSAIDIPKPKQPTAKQLTKQSAKDRAAASLEDMIRAGGTPAGGSA